LPDIYLVLLNLNHCGRRRSREQAYYKHKYYDQSGFLEKHLITSRADFNMPPGMTRRRTTVIMRDKPGQI
jgi:hypothetical protein